MALKLRVAALAAALAGTTMLAAPASAASFAERPGLGLPSTMFDASRYNPAAQSARWGCGWGGGWGCGWGGGWGGGWGRRGWRRNQVDAGDVLIGAAILGGIAAIVSSNNRRARDRDRDVVIVEHDRDFRDRNWDRDPDPRFRNDRRAAPRGTGASGLDNAVNMCLDRIERDVRVDRVDNVERTAEGWQVSGALFNGSAFRCRIGNGGQIETIDYGAGFAGISASADTTGVAPSVDGQWSDQRYADARAGLGGAVRPDLAVSEARVSAASPAEGAAAAGSAATAMPAYPGGPIPGEVVPETFEEATGG